MPQTDPKQTNKANLIGQEISQPASQSTQIENPSLSDPIFNDKEPAPPFDHPKSFNNLIAGQITTINGQLVQQLSHGISVAGNTLTPGSPAILASGNPISFGLSALVIGTSTVPFLSQPPKSSTINVAGHAMTAAPDAVAVPGTTLYSGAVGVTLDGTAISLDTSGQLVVGTKIIPLSGASISLGDSIVGDQTNGLPSDVANPFITSVANQAITIFPTAVAFAGTTLALGAAGETINGTLGELGTKGGLVVGGKTVADVGGSVRGDGHGVVKTTSAGGGARSESSGLGNTDRGVLKGGAVGTMGGLDPVKAVVIMCVGFWLL